MKPITTRKVMRVGDSHVISIPPKWYREVGEPDYVIVVAHENYLVVYPTHPEVREDGEEA